MGKEHTLASMFESNKQALEKELKGLVLPKDADRIQSIVSGYLNSMFENDGAYRQHLTQSEDYILQSALGLLNAQQGIARELGRAANVQPTITSTHESENVEVDKKKQCSYTLAGTTIGSAVGSAIGTWGAVFGAIAGTTIALYLVLYQTNQPKKSSSSKTLISPTPIRTEVFMEIIKQICEKVDDLMETFRVQVKRIQKSYEQKEETTLFGNYSALMESIENLMKASELSSTDQMEEMMLQVDMLKRSLKNYGVYYEGGKLTERK